MRPQSGEAGFQTSEGRNARCFFSDTGPNRTMKKKKEEEEEEDDFGFRERTGATVTYQMCVEDVKQTRVPD